MWNLSNWGKVLVSLTVVVGFMGILILIITTKVQGQTTPEVMLVMLGALAQGFGTIINYWTGSSQSSAMKDETLKEMATTNKTPGGA